MCNLEMWFVGKLSTAGLVVGLDDLEDLFQPKHFCDSEKHLREQNHPKLKLAIQ